MTKNYAYFSCRCKGFRSIISRKTEIKWKIVDCNCPSIREALRGVRQHGAAHSQVTAARSVWIRHRNFNEPHAYSESVPYDRGAGGSVRSQKFRVFWRTHSCRELTWKGSRSFSMIPSRLSNYIRQDVTHVFWAACKCNTIIYKPHLPASVLSMTLCCKYT